MDKCIKSMIGYSKTFICQARMGVVGKRAEISCILDFEEQDFNSPSNLSSIFCSL
jgi:hypothetical protein